MEKMSESEVYSGTFEEIQSEQTLTDGFTGIEMDAEADQAPNRNLIEQSYAIMMKRLRVSKKSV
jgi:hypothetical protein